MEDLFGNIAAESPRDTIIQNAKKGYVFYSVSQSSRLLGLSGNQTRYAIDSYRLDSLLLFGEYRIPFNALLNYMADDMGNDYLQYYSCINKMAISGVHALNFEGRIDLVVSSLRDKHIPSMSISGLMNKDIQYEYDDMPGEEQAFVDWYRLDELKLPLSSSVYGYSEILRVKSELLSKELGVSCHDEVSYQVLYDWLVEHELVNLPIPYSVAYQDCDDIDNDSQLLLGL